MLHESRNPGVLITGCSGLLGAAALFNLDFELPVYGTFLSHEARCSGRPTEKVDLSDWKATKEYLNRIQPKYIFHTAAITNIDQCEKDRDLAFRVNVEATRNLAEWAAENGSRLVYVSTDAFFDIPGRVIREDDQPTPKNYYSETKLIAKGAVKKSGAAHLILRTNIYGWNFQDKMSLAEWMYYKFKSGQNIPLVYDVSYTPILSNTFIELLPNLLLRNVSGILNVSSDAPISKLQFGETLCEIFGFDKSLIQRKSVHEINLTAPRSNSMALDNAKLKSLFPKADLSYQSDLKKFKSLLDQNYPEKLRLGLTSI